MKTKVLWSLAVLNVVLLAMFVAIHGGETVANAANGGIGRPAGRLRRGAKGGGVAQDDEVVIRTEREHILLPGSLTPRQRPVTHE